MMIGLVSTTTIGVERSVPISNFTAKLIIAMVDQFSTILFDILLRVTVSDENSVMLKLVLARKLFIIFSPPPVLRS